MHAHQHALAEIRLEAGNAPVECLGEDLADALRDLGVEAVARDEDEGRDEAVEAVAPHEQPRARPLLEAQDPVRHGGERLGIDLEQLVARQGFEDADERLSRMARRIEAAGRDDAAHLSPQERDLVGFCV